MKLTPGELDQIKENFFSRIKIDGRSIEKFKNYNLVQTDFGLRIIHYSSLPIDKSTLENLTKEVMNLDEIKKSNKAISHSDITGKEIDFTLTIDFSLEASTNIIDTNLKNSLEKSFSSSTQSAADVKSKTTDQNQSTTNFQTASTSQLPSLKSETSITSPFWSAQKNTTSLQISMVSMLVQYELSIIQKELFKNLNDGLPSIHGLNSEKYHLEQHSGQLIILGENLTGDKSTDLQGSIKKFNSSFNFKVDKQEKNDFFHSYNLKIVFTTHASVELYNQYLGEKYVPLRQKILDLIGDAPAAIKFINENKNADSAVTTIGQRDERWLNTTSETEKKYAKFILAMQIFLAELTEITDYKIEKETWQTALPNPKMSITFDNTLTSNDNFGLISQALRCFFNIQISDEFSSYNHIVIHDINKSLNNDILINHINNILHNGVPPILKGVMKVENIHQWIKNHNLPGVINLTADTVGLTAESVESMVIGYSFKLFLLTNGVISFSEIKSKEEMAKACNILGLNKVALEEFESLKEKIKKHPQFMEMPNRISAEKYLNENSHEIGIFRVGSTKNYVISYFSQNKIVHTEILDIATAKWALEKIPDKNELTNNVTSFTK